ncbi:universal stress protein UspA [Dictyobacter alpinus]|uniref:Universal stress protein UspA n=1 Tax=Dictyobacter alpinus TaxID=2014873 RepID=A0A402BBB0_9CHLR|nr:universal stress protein [Dictyobacter alpinus]GCE28570.1 universal stress protein UspA [Dictyobacter alpinus]
MFQRILVPLDGSSRAEQALPVAARLAQVSGGSIHLLQVIDLGSGYDGGLGTASFVTEQSVEIEMTQSMDYLSTATTSSKLLGIPTTTEVLFGLPAQNILATAASREIDLIILCSHGRTGFTRWALGSFAHTLAHESTVPILVLRKNEGVSLPSSAENARPLRALVPLDGSRLSEAALIPAAQLVAALAAPAQGALHLSQVVTPVPTDEKEGSVRETNEEALQSARVYLAQVTEHLQTTIKDLKLSLTSSVECEKDVATTLLHLEEHKIEGMGSCDLIAISTHGRGGLERWVMGSVTDRLLTTTKLPMLIVRPQKTGIVQP